MSNYFLLLACIFVFSLTSGIFGQNGLKILQFAAKQYSHLALMTKNGQAYPSEGKLTSDHWSTSSRNGWTSGFYPGVLWHLYNYTHDEKWKNLAMKATDGLFQEQFNTHTHDVGFMIMCSYGDGFEFTGNKTYIKVIENGAASLGKRFSSK